MRKLKNYLIYKKKLLDFASAVGVAISYSNVPGDGMYIGRVIQLDSSMSQSSEIATLLHELGHLLDDLSLSVDEYNRINAAYAQIYKEKFSKRHKATVLEREKIAWKYGENLATQLRIKLGNWFYDEEKAAIKTYRKG